MSLNAKIKQIATATVKGYVSTLTSITQNNSANNSNSVQFGIITAITNGQYSVTLADNSVQLVNPGGTRQVGPGDTVLIGGGAIIG